MVFLPAEAKKLTEKTSIDLVSKIKFEDIVTSLSPQPVSTSHTAQGEKDTPILLLHGFDSSLLEYRRLLPILSQFHITWAVDLLGFGFTERSEDLLFSPESIKTHLYYTWKTFELWQKRFLLIHT